MSIAGHIILWAVILFVIGLLVRASRWTGHGTITRERFRENDTLVHVTRITITSRSKVNQVYRSESPVRLRLLGKRRERRAAANGS